MCLGLISEKPLPIPKSQRLLCFLWRVLEFWLLHLGLWFWVNVCIMWDRELQFIPLHMDIQQPCAKGLFFPNWIVLHPSQRSVCSKYKTLFLDSQFYSIDTYACYNASLCCLEHCCLVVSFEMEKCIFKLFFFNIVLAFLVS